MNMGQVLSFKRTQNLPWISEQLKRRLKEISKHPTIWVLEEFDGYFLSMLTRPPVFWVREDVFYDTPRPVDFFSKVNQMNMKISAPSEKIPSLSSPKIGDLVAVGVSRGPTKERRLYLMKITGVPQEKANRFLVVGNLPKELGETLRNNFGVLGIHYVFVNEQGDTEKSAYRLELIP